MASPGQMDRLITLIKPPAKEEDSFGDCVDQTGAQPTRYRVWAAWQESSGAEVLEEGQEYGRFPVKITFWYNAVFAGIDTRWSVESEIGRAYDIFAITESGGRQVQIELSAIRRD